MACGLPFNAALAPCSAPVAPQHAHMEPHSCRPARSSGKAAASAGLCLAGLAASTVLSLQLPPPAVASISAGPSDEAHQRALALRQLAARYPVRSAAPQASWDDPESVPQRLQRLQQLMSAGNATAALGDYAAALAIFDSMVKQFPDFAATEYARLARALMLYQMGAISDAILQLEDLEMALRGYSEVHAALAAILYVERPAQLQQAEQQWEIAMEFNQQFSDRGWVAATKHWPPRLMAALDRFLNLQ